MSCTYADGLSYYENKGKCGLPELFDDVTELNEKVQKLACMIKEAKHVVVHTGAGISTSSGIPDFRGPNGVWTLEEKGIKPEINVSFNEARPSLTHMALVELEKKGYINFLVSQNVDGLHLRSNFPAHKLAELHGNMFLDKCGQCQRLVVRNCATQSVGQKCTGVPCPLLKANRRSCRGKLFDTILDWEAELPLRDMNLAEYHSKKADLNLCLGSTLQISPSGNFPTFNRKSGGKFVICNLQKTKHDRCATMIIRGYVDVVMEKLMKLLELKIPQYDLNVDPTIYISDTFKEYDFSEPKKIELKELS